FAYVAAHRVRVSFPTRRSSDLAGTASCLCVTGLGGRRASLFYWFGGGVPGSPAFLVAGVSSGRRWCVVRAARPGVVCWWLVFGGDRKSTRLNSSHVKISYAVFC